MAGVLISSKQTGQFLTAVANERLQPLRYADTTDLNTLIPSASVRNRTCDSEARPVSDTLSGRIQVSTTSDPSTSRRAFLRTRTGLHGIGRLRRGSVLGERMRASPGYLIDCSALLWNRGVPAGIYPTIDSYHLVPFNAPERHLLLLQFNSIKFNFIHFFLCCGSFFSGVFM